MADKEEVVVEEEADVETGEEEIEPETPSAPAAPAKAEEKPTVPQTADVIANEPYDFASCQVQVGIMFLPKPADGSPRTAVLAARTHLDDPMIRVVDAEAILAALPAPVAEMLEELKSQFPTRAMERLAKKEAKKPAAKKPAAPAKSVPAAIASIPVQPAMEVKQANLFDMFPK